MPLSLPPMRHRLPGPLAGHRLVLLVAALALVVSSIAVVPAEVEAATYQTTANLNIRSGPGTSFPVIGGIPSGASVEVTGPAESGFYPVSYNGITGFASADYLIAGGGGGGDSTPAPTGTRYVNVSNLYLRSGPSTGDGIIAVMPYGAAVQLTGEVANGFAQVTWNGRTGWAYASFLGTSGGSTPAPTTPTPTPVTPVPTTPAPQPTMAPTEAPSVPSIGDTVVGTATVATGGLNLNMRSGPGTSYGVIRSIPNGARVDVMGSAVSGFLPVRYSGTKGWASSQYLEAGSAPATPTPTATPVTPTATPVTPTATPVTPTATPVTPTPTSPPAGGGTVVGYATVTTGGLNLNMRSGPGTSFPVLRSIPNGTQVEVMGVAENGFLPVRYAGTQGWSSSEYLRTGSTPAPTATPETPTPTAMPVTPTATPATPTPTATPVTPTVPPGGGAVIDTAVVSVSGTVLNMRSGPGLQYPVLRGLANGTQVDITGAAVNGFRPIRYAGLDGWASQEYLIIGATSPGTTVPVIGDTAVSKATINATVWKRTGPGTSYPANEQLYTGRKVEVMGDPYNGWTPIRYNGSKGWVPSSYLDPGWGYTVLYQMFTTRIIPMTTAPGGGSVVINVGALSAIDITGEAVGQYLPVHWYGRLGWVDGTTLVPLDSYVDPGPRNEHEAEMIAIIYEFADKWGQDRAEFLRVARCESSLNPNAVSRDGAQGLFQFMPSTWAFTPNGKRGEDPFNPRSSADAAGWMWANGMRHHWMCQ